MSGLTKLVGAALFLGLVGVAYVVAQDRKVPANCAETSLAGCALFGVSMVELLANPEKYDRKRVRVLGYIHFEFEGNAVYLHKEDEANRLYPNGLWVSLADGVSSPDCQDAYVLIEGTFQASDRGHLGLWSGAVTETTRCMRLR
jgi:hypothetical protein